MSDRTPEFMLEEYKQIANAYQDLHAQQNELVKFYLTLVAVPASVLTVGVQLLGVESLDVAALSAVAGFGLPVMLALLTALCLVGLAVLLGLVLIRAEALLYVRTVNCVRRYFIEHDPEGTLKRYLVLADVDTFPRFFEGPSARSFWNVGIVALLNGAIVFATCLSWVQWKGLTDRWGWVPLVGSILWFGLQQFLHWKLLTDAEKNYQVRFRAPFPTESRIGIDLDGVLGDLAGAVIEEVRSVFGLRIKRQDITSHRLQECTDLTAEQVAQIFASGGVFQTMAPVSGAGEALKQLRSRGWVVQLLTDRFWGREDWSTAKSWLDEHGIEWDYLNLVRAKEKAGYAHAHGISVFVEDNYDTAISLSSVCTKVYLLDRPYNQGDVPGNVIRVASWPHIVKNLSGEGSP